MPLPCWRLHPTPSSPQTQWHHQVFMFELKLIPPETEAADMSLCAGCPPCPHQGVQSGQGALAPQCHGWGSWGRPVLEMPEGAWGTLSGTRTPPSFSAPCRAPHARAEQTGMQRCLRSVPEPNASFEPSFVCSGLEPDQNKRSWAALLKFGKLRNYSKKHNCKLPLKGESRAAGWGGTGWDYRGGMDG